MAPAVVDGDADDVADGVPGAAEDPEAEIRHILAGCVRAVAYRHFVENNLDMFTELEERQRRAWAHDEWRHQQRNKNPAQVSVAGRAGRSRLVGRDANTTENSQGSASGSNGGRTRRGGRKWGETPDEAVAALRRRMQDLNMGLSGNSGSKGLASGCGGGAGGGSGTGGSTRRNKCKSATPIQGAMPSSFASHAESLLPQTPPRSQFTFELENPLQMHATLEESRTLQRRLAMLSALQQETVKLEKLDRKQRLERRSAAALWLSATHAPP